MLVVGITTSTTTIIWAMAEMIKNPSVMKKARDELREVLQGKTRIIERDLKETHYLKLIIKETLRLHPPLPVSLPKERNEECKIKGHKKH